jgi:hypothetical protein
VSARDEACSNPELHTGGAATALLRARRSAYAQLLTGETSFKRAMIWLRAVSLIAKTNRSSQSIFDRQPTCDITAFLYKSESSALSEIGSN